MTTDSDEKKKKGCGLSSFIHRRSSSWFVPRSGSDETAVVIHSPAALKRKKVRFSDALVVVAPDSPGDVNVISQVGSNYDNNEKNNQSSCLRKTTSSSGRKIFPSGKLLPPLTTGKSTNHAARVTAVTPAVCRSLSTIIDPEVLKKMGNKEYERGRFKEAVSFYDRAIAVDPVKACYWSNKSAALTGLGKLLDAVEVCKEAVRLEGSYYIAHYHLANLYLRLGDPVKALHHYQLSGTTSTSKDFARIGLVRSHLAKFTDARERKDWHTVLRETWSIVAGGADSAPQVFASQAEALLKLLRHHEADIVLKRAPSFDIVDSTRFFGSPTYAYVLAVRAQVDMAAGRFEEAVSTAEKALDLDPGNKKIAAVRKKVCSVASCRSKGNEFFREGKFHEARVSYQDGIDHEPHNSVLLCNRAACRLMLGQLDDAVRDCNLALRLQPSYTKARLRRANCNFKMGKWEAAVRDYGVLIQEAPDDEEVRSKLREARVHLMEKQQI